MNAKAQPNLYQQDKTKSSARAALRHLHLLEPASPNERRFHRVSAELHRPEHWRRLGGAGLHLFEVILGFQTDSLGSVCDRELTTAGFWAAWSGIDERTVRRELARLHWSERTATKGRYRENNPDRDPYVVTEFFAGFGYRLWVANPYPIRGAFVRHQHAGRCLAEPGSHVRLCLEEPDRAPRWRYTASDREPLRAPSGDGVVPSVSYPGRANLVPPSVATHCLSVASSPEEKQPVREGSPSSSGDGESVPSRAERARQGEFSFAQESPDDPRAAMRRRANALFSPVLKQVPGLSRKAQHEAMQGGTLAAADPAAEGVGDAALVHAFRLCLEAVQYYQATASQRGVQLRKTFVALVRGLLPRLAMRYNGEVAEREHAERKQADRAEARAYRESVQRLLDAGFEYSRACQLAAEPDDA